MWFTFSKQHRIWSFHVDVLQRTAKKCTIKQLTTSFYVLYNNYSMSPSWIWSDKITNERVAWVGYNHLISNKGEWNNCFSKFSNRVLPPIFIFTILQSVRKENATSGHTRPDSRHHLIITYQSKWQLRKRQSVVNLWRKIIYPVKYKVNTADDFGSFQVWRKCKLGALFSIWRKTPTSGS